METPTIPRYYFNHLTLFLGYVSFKINVNESRWWKILVLLAFISNSSLAQSNKSKLMVKIGEGEAQEMVPPNKSEDEVVKACIVNAKIKAIENTFGEIFIQGNSTYIRNSKTGEKTEESQVFNFIGESYVNGEWIEDLEPPKVTTFNSNNERWVKVLVKGKIRELNVTQAKFSSEPLSCPNISCATETFNEDQEFYLHFKSPQAGYLAVYLDVPEDQKTYKLFPYKNLNTDSLVKFKADEDYYLFSSKESKICQPAFVDELVLTLKNANNAEFNKLFVIYSPERPIEKPILTKGNRTNFNTENWKLELPDFLSSEAFQKWLINVRTNSEDIQVKYFYLTVKPKQK